MFFNWYDTKGMGTNWYEYVPPQDPKELGPATSPVIDGTDTLTSYELEQLLRTQYGIAPLQEKEDEDPAIRAMQRRSQTGRLDLMNIQTIYHSDIKYDSFNDYLKANKLPDRSGFFSNTQFPEDDGITATQGAGLGYGLTGDPFMGLVGGFIGAETHIVADPTGEFNRGIPKTGIGNPLASMAIAAEYKGLAAIRDARIENPEGTVKENGFAFNLGGVTIWRDPNGTRYNGQLDRIGIDQKIAGQLEKLVMGREMGNYFMDNIFNEEDINFFAEKAVAAGIYGDGDIEGTATPGSLTGMSGIDFNDMILSTKNGGYRLDGSFNFKGQVGRNGFDVDFKDLTRDVFNGNKNVARGWLNTSRSTRNASAAQKIQSLQYFILQSRGYDPLEARQWVATGALKAAAITSTGIRPAVPVTGSGQIVSGSDGRQTLKPATQSPNFLGIREPSEAPPGAQTFVNVPGVGFVPPERAASIRAERARSGGGDRDESMDRGLSRESVSTPSSSGDPRGYSMRALGGDVPTEPEGFVQGAPQPREEDGFVSRAEADRPAPESGFIVRPPSEVSDNASIADDIDMEPEVGGEILNASAVTMAGEKDIYEMIEDAKKYRKNVKGIDKPVETSNIKISEGEVYIEPELADIIGRDKIRKINERGVPATKKKQQRSIFNFFSK